MLCEVDGEQPPQAEKQAWEELICELSANTEKETKDGGVRKVQIYGKVRSSPKDPLASPLPDDYLEARAASLRRAFTNRGISIPIEVYL
jgi:hypothetical protein